MTGRSEQLKRRLVEQIVKDVMTILDSEEESISVAIEDIGPGEWMSKVYEPEIIPSWEKLLKKPGYGHLPTPMIAGGR